MDNCVISVRRKNRILSISVRACKVSHTVPLHRRMDRNRKAINTHASRGKQT